MPTRRKSATAPLKLPVDQAREEMGDNRAARPSNDSIEPEPQNGVTVKDIRPAQRAGRPRQVKRDRKPAD